MTRRAGAATRALSVAVLTSLDEAVAIEQEWDALARRTSAQPFGLPALALAWWRRLGKGELRIVTVRSAAGELVGVAPLHERRIGGFGVVRPLGHGMGAIASPLSAPVKADVDGLLVGAALGDGSRAVHCADLAHGDPALRSARRNPDLAVHATLHDECPVIDFAGAQSAEALLGGPAFSGVRKQLNRTDRDLAGRSVDVHQATGRDEVLAAFAEVRSLYDCAEEARPRLHLGRGVHGEFFGEALASLAERGQVAFLVLRIDGAAAAFDVLVRNGRTAYAILGRMHPDAASWSPGHLLLRAGIDWALASGLDRIDLQLGADQYKTSWSTGSYDTFEVVVSEPRSLLGARLLLGGVESAHRLRRGVVELVGNAR
jgi:CelD/BcsL family acetyltransferase involved in cellulose biosynthesis